MILFRLCVKWHCSASTRGSGNASPQIVRRISSGRRGNNLNSQAGLRVHFWTSALDWVDDIRKIGLWFLKGIIF